MHISIDGIMGKAPDIECRFTKFVTDLEDGLETAYRNVRENLKVLQESKRTHDEGVKDTVSQTGDLVLPNTPELKPGEASKFHRQWEEPYDKEARVSHVT